MEVTREYLTTSQSDIQYRDRAWEVVEDTLLINFMAQLNEAGSFTSGVVANKIAKRYMDKMIETEISKTDQEALNFRIFQETARENGRDPSKIRGTGTIRENVPDNMKEDICKRPERNSRPRPIKDNSTSVLYDDKLDFN